MLVKTVCWWKTDSFCLRQHTFHQHTHFHQHPSPTLDQFFTNIVKVDFSPTFKKIFTNIRNFLHQHASPTYMKMLSFTNIPFTNITEILHQHTFFHQHTLFTNILHQHYLFFWPWFGWTFFTNITIFHQHANFTNILHQH